MIKIIKNKATNLVMGLSLIGLIGACSAVNEKAAEISNAIEVKGHWLMTESEQSNQIEKAVENESMVLTFKDGKAAFAPTDSVKGRAVFALLSNCTVGPRPYQTEKNQIVFSAVAGCEEKRITVQALDGSTVGINFSPQTFDFGFAVGGGVDFGPVFASVRYTLGISNLDENSADWKSRGVHLLAGLRL